MLSIDSLAQPLVTPPVFILPDVADWKPNAKAEKPRLASRGVGLSQADRLAIVVVELRYAHLILVPQTCSIRTQFAGFSEPMILSIAKSKNALRCSRYCIAIRVGHCEVKHC